MIHPAALQSELAQIHSLQARIHAAVGNKYPSDAQFRLLIALREREEEIAAQLEPQPTPAKI